MDRPQPRPVPDGPSDHDLLKAMAADDVAAFETLVERWRPRVVNFLVSRGADRESAEDCAQETFVRIHGYRHSYRPEAPFTAFLFTVARNALMDWKRSRARHRDREGGPAGLDDVADGRAPDPLARLDLEAALATLPPHLARVADLAGVRGLPYRAVSALLGIPEGTVKSRMHHVVKHLRGVLGDA
jgi:RNA polymerase sigma-70 factor (ECF subfamily)